MKHQNNVDLALKAWKKTRSRSDSAVGSNGLGPESRQKLKQAVYAQQGQGLAGQRIWGPSLRWALALGLPALAIASLVGLQQISPDSPKSKSLGPVVESMSTGASEGVFNAPSSEAPQIEASKENGQVVFRIAGARLHRVATSDRPDGFQGSRSIEGGQFVDTLESDGTLTFYRID